MIKFTNRKEFNDFTEKYNNVYLIGAKDGIEYWSVGNKLEKISYSTTVKVIDNPRDECYNKV